MAKQTAAVRKAICVVQLQLDHTYIYSTRPFLRKQIPTVTGGDEMQTKLSRDSKLRPKSPSTVLGLLGQANRGRPEGHFCRRTPTSSHMPIKHMAVFAREKKSPRRRKGGNGHQMQQEVKLRPLSPFTVLGLLSQANRGRSERSVCVVQLQLDHTYICSIRPFLRK